MANKLSDIIANTKNISATAYSKRISIWFKEEVFARLLKNAGILLSGNIASSLLRLAALAIITRALNPSDFGVLVLIETYATLFDLLFNFQSWEALIKYGAEALNTKDHTGFKKLIKFGTLLDAGSAFLATVFAVSFAYVIGALKGWDAGLTQMVMIYSTVILFNLSGTPIAILRLFDKFNLFSFQSILTSAIKLAGVTIAYFNGAGLRGFIYVWMLTEIFSKLFLFSAGWWMIKTKGYKDIMRIPVKGIEKRFKGIWHFVWASNISTTFVNFSRHFDKIIILHILNAEAVAFYKLVQSLNNIILKVMNPLYLSVYPEVARLISIKDMNNLNRLLKRTSFIIFFIALVFYVGFVSGIDIFVNMVFGKTYGGVGTIAIFYILGTLISFIFYYAHPLVLAFGEATVALRINIITITLYMMILYLLTYHFGLIGAAISFSLFMTSAVTFRIYYIQKKYNIFKRITD